MRQIIFRGKRIDNGEWVFGDLIRNLIYDGREKEMRIGDIYFEHNGDIHGTAVCKVIPETVGQFTGLTDRNGKKIFEGDIVKAYFQPRNFKNPPYAIGSVIFENGTFKVVVHISKNSIEYKVFEKEDIAAYSIEHNFLDRYYVLEVIGNIHDKPELLEKL